MKKPDVYSIPDRQRLSYIPFYPYRPWKQTLGSFCAKMSESPKKSRKHSPFFKVLGIREVEGGKNLINTKERLTPIM